MDRYEPEAQNPTLVKIRVSGAGKGSSRIVERLTGTTPEEVTEVIREAIATFLAAQK